MALGTNGVLFDTGRDGQIALEHLTWLRFNISAASRGSYQLLHDSPDFDILIEKLNLHRYQAEKQPFGDHRIPDGFDTTGHQ